MPAAPRGLHNPFLRYRPRFHSYHVARAAGWSDDRYVDLVRELDDAIADVDGDGFRATPIVRSSSLDQALGFDPGAGVWVKDETGNVSGSHKARHLMGVMLGLRVAEALDLADPDAPLAIASCGNAALAAAVVARAARRRLLVFVPPSGRRGRHRAAALAPRRDRGLRAPATSRRPDRGSADGGHRRRRGAVHGAGQPQRAGHRGWRHAGLGAHRPAAGRRLGARPTRHPRRRWCLRFGRGPGLRGSVARGQLEQLPVIDTVQTRGGYPLARAHERVLEQLGATAGTPLDAASSKSACARSRAIAPATCGPGRPSPSASPTASSTTRRTTGSPWCGPCS